MPLFEGADPVLLASLIMALKPVVFQPGDEVVRRGEIGRELYLISRGEVDVTDATGAVLATLGEGNFFGEISLLTSAPRNATVRAKSHCDLFVLEKSDFARVLRDRPHFLKTIMEIAQGRYNVSADEVLSDHAAAHAESHSA